MKNRISVILLRRILYGIGTLPLPVRAIFGRWLGRIFSLIPTRDRKIAKLHMDAFLKNEGGSAHLSQMYSSVGETLFEALNLKPLLDNYQTFVDADWAQMDEIVSRKKGVIILSAHTGNWDLLAACSVKRGFKVTVIGKPTKSAGLQDALSEVRANYGVTTLWRSGASSIRHILAILKKGESVAALIDQDTEVISKMVPFFGRLAATPETLIELGKRCGAIIVMPFIVRTGTNHYKITVTELDPSLSTVEMLVVFNNSLEKLIRKHPSQWVWFHKRWRTLESGERLSSRNYVESLQTR